MAKIAVIFPIKKMLDSLDKIKREVSRAGEIATMDVAEFISKEAKKRAPEDTGKLMTNIRVERRKNLRVDVINDVTSDQGFGYGAFLHENPRWDLGAKSKLKDARQSEKVGSKWLNRAFTENRKDVEDIYVNSFRRNLNF